MGGRRALLLVSLFGLLAIWTPLAVRGFAEELGRQDPQATATWQTVDGVGLRLRIPPGWKAHEPGDGIAGLYLLRVSAPPCADAPTLGCALPGVAPLAIDVAAERLDNSATSPGDEFVAAREREGYLRRPAMLNGQPAALLSAHDVRAAIARVIVSEFGQARYHLLLREPTADEAEIVALILGSVVFEPERAPAVGSFPPAAPGSADNARHRLFLTMLRGQGALQPAASPQATTPYLSAKPGSVSYAPAKAVAEALFYAYRADNRDGCYIYGTREEPFQLACEPRYDGRFDGAHFVSCALVAGQLPGVTCDRLSSRFYRARELRAHFESAIPYKVVTAPTTRPGDVFFVRPFAGGEPCWTGIVTDANGPMGAMHSNIASPVPDGVFRISGLRCNGGSDVEFLRVVNDDVQPVVTIASPAAGRLAPGLIELSYSAEDPLVNGEPGSGVRNFDVQLALASAEPVTIVAESASRLQRLPLFSACQDATITVLARDNADNLGQASVQVSLSMLGDADLNGAIDAADIVAAEAAWGLRLGEPGYSSSLDVTGDDLIDAADILWLRSHLGDRCP